MPLVSPVGCWIMVDCLSLQLRGKCKAVPQTRLHKQWHVVNYQIWWKPCLDPCISATPIIGRQNTASKWEWTSSTGKWIAPATIRCCATLSHQAVWLRTVDWNLWNCGNCNWKSIKCSLSYHLFYTKWCSMACAAEFVRQFPVLETIASEVKSKIQSTLPTVRQPHQHITNSTNHRMPLLVSKPLWWHNNVHGGIRTTASLVDGDAIGLTRWVMDWQAEYLPGDNGHWERHPSVVPGVTSTCHTFE